MYGMSEKEFWDDDPQLYWAYHIFYNKKREDEMEQLKFTIWSQGNTNYIALSSALSDGFRKQGTPAQGFPSFEEFYKGKPAEKTENEKNEIIIRENNYWARF